MTQKRLRAGSRVFLGTKRPPLLPQNLWKRWGAKHPTFSNGFAAGGGVLDPQKSTVSGPEALLRNLQYFGSIPCLEILMALVVRTRSRGKEFLSGLISVVCLCVLGPRTLGPGRGSRALGPGAGPGADRARGWFARLRRAYEIKAVSRHRARPADAEEI